MQHKTNEQFGNKLDRSTFNSFVPNTPFLYHLKTSENLFIGGRERVHWKQIR